MNSLYMKKILFIASNAIPVNGPEAIVNAKLLKELSVHYTIDVISKDGRNKYFAESFDVIFTENLNSLNIIASDNKINIGSVIDHFKVLFKTGYVYKGAHWAYYAIKFAEKLISQNNYDFIMSRNPPSELAGYFLSKKYNIPLIANWNDPYPEKRMPAPYGKGENASLSYFEQKLLNNISKHAYYHTFSSERQMKYMLKYMNGACKDRSITIPHICIDGIFTPIDYKNDGCLNIVHSGNVSYPRDPYNFLMGVKKFIYDNKNAKIKIHFIGKQNDNFETTINELELSNWVVVTPPMSYINNLEYISKYNVALLIEAESEESVYLPTKVGDYMQCKKDIWSISPKVGTLNDMHKEGKIKYFSDCSSPQAIKETLGDIYNNFIEFGYNYNSENSIVDEYSSTYVIKQYNKILG